MHQGLVWFGRIHSRLPTACVKCSGTSSVGSTGTLSLQHAPQPKHGGTGAITAL